MRPSAPTGRCRGLAAAVGALLCVAVLAGCGLPSSSAVQDGRPVGDNVAPRARVVVAPPSVGAPPEVIARDFIRAGAAFNETGDDQQVVGRAFLAPTSVALWRPTALTTTVYDSRTPVGIQALPGDRLQLTITAVATLDETGHYRELRPGTQVTTVFAMTRVEGEWRIMLPDSGFGLWLDTDDFTRVFGPYAVHYVLTDRRELVPDVRWFPLGPRLPTALARAQLSSVPAYLSGVVDTAIPGGTRLAVDAVNVDTAGVATVTLTNSPQTIDPARRRPMWAQFLATLAQAPGVVAVSLEVQGIGPIPVSSLPGPVSSLSELGFDRPAMDPPTVGLVRAKDLLERINPQLIDESSPPFAARAPKAPADLPRIPESYGSLSLSTDGSEIAGVSTGRSELARWRGGQGLSVPPFGTALTRPRYASDGRLWVAGLAADGNARIWTFDGSDIRSAPSEVRASWLAGRHVVSLAVSPDATRVAVISMLPNGTDVRLDVAGIVRGGADGISLAQPYRQGEPLTGLVDVTWLDQMTMAVLGREAAGAPLRPWRVDLGQGVGLRRVGQLDLDQTLIKEVPDATSLTSRGGVRGLIVTTPTGVFIRAGNAWAKQGNLTDLLVAGT